MKCVNCQLLIFSTNCKVNCVLTDSVNCVQGINYQLLINSTAWIVNCVLTYLGCQLSIKQFYCFFYIDIEASQLKCRSKQPNRARVSLTSCQLCLLKYFFSKVIKFYLARPNLYQCVKNGQKTEILHSTNSD